MEDLPMTAPETAARPAIRNEALGIADRRGNRAAIRALRAILAISVFGTAFSGVLTYRELFGETAMSCPAPGAPGTVFGYPACVYGFFMYTTIAIIAAAGLWRSRADASQA
jgi:uncharacterized membrane protein